MIAKPAATAATCGRKNPSAAAPSVEISSGQSRLSSVRPGWSSGSVVWNFASASSRAIGGEAWLRRPTHAPARAATSHQPIAISDVVLSPSWDVPTSVSAASSVADPALSITVALRKSTKRTEASGDERPQELAHAVGPLDHHVGLALERRRPLVGADPDSQRVLQPPHLDELAEAAEGVEVRHVVADVHRGGQVRVAQEGDDPRALVDPDGRADLEHLPAPVRGVTGGLRPLRDAPHRGLGALLVGHAAPVQRGDRLLVLQPDAQAAQLVAEGLAHEAA